MTNLKRVATIGDLARLARRRMPRFAFDYLEGGAGDDKGVIRNRQQLDRILLRPTLGCGVTPEISVSLFGQNYSMPFGIAPTGPNNLLWPGADAMLALVARTNNIPVVLSTMATTAVERFAEIAGISPWFQLYPLRSDKVADDLLARVWGAGVRVLVVTIDVTTNAIRNRDVRGGFNEPGFLRSRRFLMDAARRPIWLLGQLKQGKPRLPNLTPYIGASSLNWETARSAGDLLRHDVRWEHLKFLRERWKGSLIIKGILDPDDAVRAIELGADGVWVSNHGGRQFESAPASIDALPLIKARIGNRAKLFMDGGIRSGEDIVKAGACGADMAFSGRSLLYGIGAADAVGAQHGLKILRDGTFAALAQLGCAAYHLLDSKWIWRTDEPALSARAPD